MIILKTRKGGVVPLNVMLQSHLNPSKALGYKIFEETIRPGDRVMQTRNNYDLGIFNGEVGVVMDTTQRHITVRFDEIVDMIVEIIETIISKAQELGVEFEARGYKSIINDDNRMPSQDTGFQIISQAYDRFNRASSEAFLKSKAMQTSILQTRTDLGFLNELAGQHTKHLNEIDEMIQLLTNWAEVKKIDIDDSSIASTVVFEKPEDEDDLDDSIELF